MNQEADEIAYRVAFSCQRTAYILDTGKSKRDFGTKYTKTELVNKLKEICKILDEDYTLESYVVVEPDYIAKARLDRQIQKLYQVEVDGHKISKVWLWLSPSDHSNFRYSIVNFPGPKGMGYKAGRGEKPYHLQLVRQRLIDKWEAREAQGCEADDMLSMHQRCNTIASHIDKDINMVPGWHYNWVEDEIYLIPDGLGMLVMDNKRLKKGGIIFFYAQMLMGDATDNIPGINKLGPVKAYNLLKDCTTEQQAFDIVKAQYQKQYEEIWQDVLEEVADLLWMVRNDALTGRQYLKERGFIE